MVIAGPDIGSSGEIEVNVPVKLSVTMTVEVDGEPGITLERDKFGVKVKLEP